MTGEDLVSAVEALKATEIKAELAVFGATTAGVKAQLVERLTRCYELKREGKDVKAELRRRTLDRLGEAEEAKAEAMRRRDARRRRGGRVRARRRRRRRQSAWGRLEGAELETVAR
jgi:hypothetical protein